MEALDMEEARRRKHAYAGFDGSLGGWPIPSPFNAHVHLRCPTTQFNIFALAVRESAKVYGLVTAMPNLGEHRILSPDRALNYRSACEHEGRKYNPAFGVIVPFYLEPTTDPKVVREGFSKGAWKCGKLYPKNGTTGSDFGVDFRNIRDLFPVFEVMEDLGILLLVHGESVLDADGCLIPDRKREPLATPVIEEIFARFPKIRLVFEHISSREAVAALTEWRKQGYDVEATVAPQYLVWNSTRLFAGGMNPVCYSIPILKDEGDRKALIEFIVRGGGMLGTDSAPHDLKAKSRAIGCPGGVFSEPVSLFVYFHIFRTYGGTDWFDAFIRFSCLKARLFYGELISDAAPALVIREQGWDVPETYTNADATLVPMFSGKHMPYSLHRA